MLTRRQFLTGAALSSAAILFFADEIGRHELELTHHTFHIPNLPPAFHGFRIVQFSDIHLEEYTEDFFLRRVIARVNALAPDLVLITGDFISRGPLPIALSYESAARCAQILSTLTCKQRFGVLGNHDAAVGSRLVRAHMEANGLPLLVNQHIPIERDNQRILLAGLDNISQGFPNLTLTVPDNPGCPVILMCHEPDYASDISCHPRGRFVDLILSGHSHGGQVRLPGVRPLALPPLGRVYVQGHFQVGTSQLYVNRGIGTVGLPLRLNCLPEITEITLQPLES